MVGPVDEGSKGTGAAGERERERGGQRSPFFSFLFVWSFVLLVVWLLAGVSSL